MVMHQDFVSQGLHRKTPSRREHLHRVLTQDCTLSILNSIYPPTLDKHINYNILKHEVKNSIMDLFPDSSEKERERERDSVSKI